MNTTVRLSQDELNLAYEWGFQRASIMAAKADKPGSLKKNEFHTPVQADALGIAAEIAACKFLGVSYLNRGIYVPVAELDAYGNLPAECKVPDILGRYEVRRSEEAHTPIKMWDKDIDAKAWVLQAVVEHDHLDNGRIKASGFVEFIGWSDAAVDTKWARYKNNTYQRSMKRPMETLVKP